MKLWFLTARDEELPDDDNPWLDEYDKNFSLVIRAETEEQARQFAQDNSDRESNARKNGEIVEPWLTDKYTTCQELTPAGNVGVICTDHKNG